MLWFETALLSEGWREHVRIHVSGGLISRIERGVDPAPGDERHGTAIPGLANVHSHGFQRGMAGLAEIRGPQGDNFWTWREVMYRFLDRLDPDDVEAITAEAYLEMLERGFTRVGEFHYLHHDPSGMPYANVGELSSRVVAAAQDTAIGLTLLPVFYAHSNFGGLPPLASQRRFINDIERFAAIVGECCKAVSKLKDANVGIAPHSLRAVTPEELENVLPLSRGGPIHIHASEQTKEVDDCVAWTGARPVEWLLDHANVDEHWCLVHATHMTEREVVRLAESGAVAGLCPVTEANLGDGIFPAESYLRAGGTFGIGTDSNVSIDAAGELRALEYAQRLTQRSRNVLAPAEGTSTGRSLFDAAIAGGAKALGLATAGLLEGASADIVALNASDAALAGRTGDFVVDSWIFAGAAVDCVWRHGREVVRQGRHVDRERIQARYRNTMKRLME